MDVLWTCTIGVLWLDFFGTKVLTILFFPKLNPLSDTKILLLYSTIPDVIFRFLSLARIYFLPCCNQPYSMHN